jgi:hypothetical protein
LARFLGTSLELLPFELDGDRNGGYHRPNLLRLTALFREVMMKSSILLFLPLVALVMAGSAYAETYGERVNRCLKDFETEGGDMDAKAQKAKECMSGGATQKVEQSGGHVNITTSINGKTMTVTKTLKPGESISLDGAKVTIAPPHKPSPAAAKALGPDFEWDKMGPDDAKVLDACIADYQCDAEAYLAGSRNAMQDDALELSKCVKSKECDLAAYEKAYAVHPFHRDALHVARAVAGGTVSLETYLTAYGLHPFHNDAYTIASCEAGDQCDFNAYKQVFMRHPFHDDALNAAKCVKAQQCDLNAYLQAYSIHPFHDDAMRISRSFAGRASNRLGSPGAAR